MRIAIPLAEGSLAMHFGHCEQFAILDTDPETNAILSKKEIQPPPHEPGLLPRWLAEQGAELIIAGGMGQRAVQLFTQNNIKVVVGAPVKSPEDIVAAYVNGTLESGTNACDH